MSSERVENPAHLGPALGQAARCLATAADSLSAAAHALAEAAQMFSEMDRAGNLPRVAIREPAGPQAERMGGTALQVSRNRGEDSDSESEDTKSSVGNLNSQTPHFHRVGDIPSMSGSNAQASAGASFQTSLTVHTYIALTEDFDAIPLIGYFANQNMKTVCFISHHRNLSPYKKMLSSVVGGNVERPGNKQKSIDKAIAAFAQSDSSVLLLRGDCEAPAVLGDISVDVVIHWGFPPGSSFVQQIKLPKATRTILILSVGEKSRAVDHVLSATRVVEHPEAAQLTEVTPDSPLSSIRERMLALLATMPLQPIKKIYEIQLARPGASPLEVARRANRFVARVLLHGDISDGSTVFKPIGERPPAKAKVARSRGLQSAVDRGLVTIAQPQIPHHL